MEKYEKLRVNTLMPKNIIEKVDQFALELGLSRGNALSVIAKQFFDQQEVIKMAEIMKELEKKDPTK